MPLPFANLGPEVIAAFGATAILPVTRRAAGTYSEATGLFDQGATEASFSIDAAIQPATPKDRELLPENERTKESIVVYSVAPLRTSDVSQGLEADVVTWEERTWRVTSVENWAPEAGYYRSVAVREGS